MSPRFPLTTWEPQSSAGRMVRWYGVWLVAELMLASVVACSSTSTVRDGDDDGEGGDAGGASGRGGGGRGGFAAGGSGGSGLSVEGGNAGMGGDDATAGDTSGAGGADVDPGPGGLGGEGGQGGSSVEPLPPPVCVPLQPSCVDQRAVQCNDEGTGYEGEGTECAASETCVSGVCEEHECPAGERFCSGNAVRQCAEDGLSSDEVDTCGAGEYCDAEAAECKPGVCAPDQPACDGNTATQCDAAGAGFVAAGTDCGPTATCDAGVCRPHVCTPDATFCQGQQVKQCTANGLSSTLVSSCSGQTCVASGATAACTGVCAPTQQQCSSNRVQSCTSSGAWSNVTDCNAANRTCVESGDAAGCTGSCSPSQQRCSANRVQECSETGAWVNGAENCTSSNQTCLVSGGVATCGGVCAPGQTRCSGAGVQSCTAAGQWGSAQACSFVCTAGACAGECTPSDKRCASGSGVPQLCDAGGIWRNQTACGSDKTCTAGECLCVSGLTDCSGSCVTLSSSAAHCGSCGHSCLGGECASGKCEPAEVATSLTEPGYLALSSTHVYWMDKGSRVGNLRRVSKNGGTVETLHTGSNVGFPGGVDIYNNQVYWGTTDANSGGIVTPRLYRANLDGTNRVEFAPVQGRVQGVQVVGDIAYWAEYIGTSFTFFSKAVTGTSAPSPVVSNVSSGGGFTWAGNCLYYTPGNTSLSRVCGNPTGVFTGSVSLGQHAPSDASMIYFGATGQGLMRLSLTASQPASLVTAGTDVRSPLVDGNFIYFIDGDTGGAPACTTNWSIGRSGKTPGSTRITLVAPPLDCPAYLIDDGEALYWMERTLIKKVAKP